MLNKLKKIIVTIVVIVAAMFLEAVASIGSIMAGSMTLQWVNSIGIHDPVCLGSAFFGVIIVMALMTTPTVTFGALGLVDEITNKEEEATA